MSRTAFLIDGFNLYHSVREASYDLGLGGAGTKWLDICSLCRSFLQLMGPDATLESVFYFSAPATHLQMTNPGVVSRHMAFVKCLKDTGVQVEMGRFKPKNVYCRRCRNSNRHHEEKESDVAISVRLLELMFTDCCDAAVLITGDTDIAPAVRTAQKLFPHKPIYFAFPYKRKNDELAGLVSRTFKMSKEQYQQHQFSDPYTLRGGKQMTKPPKW